VPVIEALRNTYRVELARAAAAFQARVPILKFLDRVPTQRFFSLAGVACLHILVLLVLFHGFSKPEWTPPGTAQTLIILPLPKVPQSEPRLPKFVEPQQDAITVPQIDIAVEDKPVQTMAAGTSLMLFPPRPDPAHFNASPALPQQFKTLAANALVELRVMVEPDGGISDAEITHSTGNGDLDAVAVAFVKEHWRFRPALLGSTPTKDWVTVICQFVSAG
jgi:TonB family protein